MRTTSNHPSIVATARLEADRMRTTVIEKADTATVRMSAAQFRRLALLIERLTDLCAADHPSNTCWLDDGDDSASRFRAWVPLSHYSAAREALDAHQAEVIEARTQLEAREADYVRLTSMAFGLTAPASLHEPL